MDPVGFALENFDAVGRWRTEEHGEPIVATGTLVDGTHIDGASELRTALLKYSDRFVQTVTEKLMTYALGRGLEYYDMPAVRQIARAGAKNDYRFVDRDRNRRECAFPNAGDGNGARCNSDRG